jgi:hypothetical protein
MWVWRWLDSGERDVRHTLRVLRRSPGFTATALLSLAIGIGASTALFSLVDQVLLRPLAVREPERLVHLAWKGNALATGWGNGYVMSYPMCRELQEQRDVFDGVFCRHPTSAHVSMGGRSSSQVRAEMVSGSYFPVLGVAPALGRLIGPSDDLERGAHPVVAEVDPALPVSLTIFDDQIERSLRTERLLAAVSSAFGAIALLLAVVGLYGVTSFVVTQRTAEIGVCMALGATRPRALWLILRDAAIMVAAGVVIALPVASALRRFVESQLFGVGAFDLPTIVIASALVATAALSSAMLPAWRAASINPTDALRA